MSTHCFQSSEIFGIWCITNVHAPNRIAFTGATERYEETQIMVMVKNHANLFLKNQTSPLINQHCLVLAMKFCLSMVNFAECNLSRKGDEWRFLQEYAKMSLPIAEDLAEADMLKCSHRYNLRKHWRKPSSDIKDQCIELYTLMCEKWP